MSKPILKFDANKKVFTYVAFFLIALALTTFAIGIFFLVRLTSGQTQSATIEEKPTTDTA